MRLHSLGVEALNKIHLNLLVVAALFPFPGLEQRYLITAAIRARHHCVPESTVAKVLGLHQDCVNLIDGPTCTDATVRDGGCKDTRIRNFTACGAVVYNEVEDPESPANATNVARTFSHCAYAARPAGFPCIPGGNALEPSSSASAAAGPAGALSVEEKGAAARTARDAPAYVCGGGGLSGMCVLAGLHAGEHERCVEFVCEKGTCGKPMPTNEGGECTPPGAAAAVPLPACQRRACRSGRCVVEPVPDDQPCGPAGPCGEHLCVAGTCVRNWEEDGVMCGPSTACADQVCISGECVEERRPDGKMCGHGAGGCPRMCAAGKCVGCNCGPAFAFWAGRQHVPGFQWTPFPTDLRENSFGGYFNLQVEEMDIPPVMLPLNGSSKAAMRSAESAIVVCSGCRLGMQLQPGDNMVQGGALVTGSVGLSASRVRGGTYVILDVVMQSNVSHHHLVVGWHPWASQRPPPLNTPHRWGDLSSGQQAPSPVPGQSPEYVGLGLLPRPARHHSAWAFVRQHRTYWALTAYEQVRSVFVGLHMTVASCSKVPPLSAAVPSGASSAKHPPLQNPDLRAHQHHQHYHHHASPRQQQQHAQQPHAQKAPSATDVAVAEPASGGGAAAPTAVAVVAGSAARSGHIHSSSATGSSGGGGGSSGSAGEA